MAFSYCLQLTNSMWHSHSKVLQYSFKKQGSAASVDTDEYQSSPAFFFVYAHRNNYTHH